MPAIVTIILYIFCQKKFCHDILLRTGMEKVVLYFSALYKTAIRAKKLRNKSGLFLL